MLLYFLYLLNNGLTISTDGFFDAGMLLHALKGLNSERERTADKPAKRRVVGKKLHMNEY